ncbi:hypothetical protein CR513_49577, partial [Mucuna pruriens]
MTYIKSTLLKQSLAKFVNGTKNLNKLLKYNRSPHDKSGVGFEKENEIKEKPNIYYPMISESIQKDRPNLKGLTQKDPRKFGKETLVMVLGQWSICSKTLDQRKEDELPLEGKIVGVGRIGKRPFLSINNVLYVKVLKHNLLSISQLCDSGYDVSFNKGECINNLYIDLTNLANQNVTCLMSINDDWWTWHKKLGHASLRLISKLKKHNLVRGQRIVRTKSSQIKESSRPDKIPLDVGTVLDRRKSTTHRNCPGPDEADSNLDANLKLDVDSHRAGSIPTSED